MKTQIVSNQSFTAGKLFFLNKEGHVSKNKLRYELESMNADIQQIRHIVRKKPYDLYIAEKDARDPWLLRISTQKEPGSGHEHYIAKTLSIYLADIAKTVMKNYEKSVGMQ